MRMQQGEDEAVFVEVPLPWVQGVGRKGSFKGFFKGSFKGSIGV